MKYILFLILPILFLSCIPEESPVEPFDRGDMQIGDVEMGNFYEYQIYYSLTSNNEVSINETVAWDIGFSCPDTTLHIILNYSTSARAVNLGKIDFDNINEDVLEEIEEEDWKFDNQFGNIDSTSIGTWWMYNNGEINSKHDVYIIDRGITPKGRSRGYVKLRITGFENNSYFIEFAELDENILYKFEVNKDNQFNYKQFCFTDGGLIVQLEPDKNSWDLLFSKYIDLLYTNEGDALWYSVTSVLLNENGVQAAMIKSNDFNSIDISVVDTLNFNSTINTIGHEWKYFDLESNSYTVLDDQIYIIKNVDGFYFKLKFVEFYNESGLKGYPKFELKLL